MTSHNKNEPTPLLSIIILSFNTKDITRECIESIYRSLETVGNDLLAHRTRRVGGEGGKPFPTYETVIVDNASTDGSVQMLKELQKKYPDIVFIENKENNGFARGNNQAVKHAKGTYILFLNSDIIVLNNAIHTLFEYYRSHESFVHFLGGKLLNTDKSPQPSCGPFYTIPVIAGALFLRGDHWGLTRYSPNAPKQVDWISGACILTKKEYFEKLTGFDEKIFMYMEEIDLLYRAKKQGYSTFFCPEAEFIHFGSASSGGRTYPIIQVYKGFLYFYRKHYPVWMFNMLQYILKLKALLVILLGKLLRRPDLIKTYEQAYHIASMD